MVCLFLCLFVCLPLINSLFVLPAKGRMRHPVEEGEKIITNSSSNPKGSKVCGRSVAATVTVLVKSVKE